MRIILAESIDGGIFAILVLLAGLAASLLAIFALFPAANGKKAMTLAMAAPAFLAGIAITISEVCAYVQIEDRSDFEFWSDGFMPWGPVRRTVVRNEPAGRFGFVEAEEENRGGRGGGAWRGRGFGE